MIENCKSSGLFATDVRFTASVLRDAENLEWREGQLERRKMAVQKVMTGRNSETWREEAGLFGLLEADDSENELFKRHGWNKVDSGFQLWGAGISKKAPVGDEFLQSKVSVGYA